MLPETVLVEEQHPYTLASYAYRQDLEHWRPIWENIEGSVAIIDSGAFTAHTQGKPIEVTDYIDFIGSYREEASPSLSDLYFIALDVIGDQKATWTNFNALEKAGETTLPVITYGAPAKDVDRAAEHPYICIGGLVGRPRAEVQSYLDGVFARLVKRPELPRVHLLGLAQRWALTRYPAFSCDASSWLGPVMFGSDLKELKGAPSYTTGTEARAALTLSLRTRIRKLQKLQNDSTRLWEKRGVRWT